MLESVISGIAVPVFEQLWKAGGTVVGQVRAGREYVQKVENILKASREYHQKYENRHGKIKILPGLMKGPIHLDSIYTTVQFLDEQSIHYFATSHDLEKLYREQGRRRFQIVDECHDGMTVAKENQYLMVLGGPGIGKTTFLKKLGLESLKGEKGQLQREKIPVFIELKTLRNATIDLTNVIAREFEICGFPDAKKFTDLSLNQGKLLLLLDGLDEVPSHNINHVIEQIEAFVTQYDKNTFIASCRTAAYRSNFQQFIDVTIANFGDEQIQQFIQQWFNSEHVQELDVANQCWQLLQKPENVAAKELAQTPLLLAYLCLMYEQEKTLSSRRSILYEQVLNLILSQWSAQKLSGQSYVYRDFHPELEKELLSEIAYTSLKEDYFFFSKSDITDRIRSYLSDTLNAPKHLDSQEILKAIEVQQGIFIEQAANTYSFSHLTLQEYLAALYVVKNQLISEIVSQYLFKIRWREVLLLSIGLMGRRGYELLEAIEQQAKTYIDAQPKVRYLVQWANQVTQDSPSESESLIKIVSALVLVIDIARFTVRDSIFDISEAINSLSDGDDDVANELTGGIIENLSESYANALVFDSDGKLEIEIDDDIARLMPNKLFNMNRFLTSTCVSSIVRYLHSRIDRHRTSENTLATSSAVSIANAINSSSDIIDIMIAASGAVKSFFYLDELGIFNTSVFKDVPRQLLNLHEKAPHLSTADEWFSYADELKAIWSNALGLTIETISLSSEEWVCFYQYLYANELLLSCKEASIGISQKEWKALKARLLTID